MVGTLAAAALLAHAGERATLRNGFAMQCDHHAAVDGHLRLYLGKGEASYIDLKPEEVAGFEAVADAPAQTAASAAKESAAEGKLSSVDLNQMLSSAGQEHNVDADLLASVVKAESGGDARAVSRAGARGLMQLMPSTATDLGVSDTLKPGENIRGGTTYLDQLLMRYHDNLALALAAYNAGPAAVDKYHGIPPFHETQAYVARVIHEFNRRVRAREAEVRRAQSSVVANRVPASQEATRSSQ
jgi:soluble lytic murein transglycosylase-like protein